jgi:ATP-dependent Clp protease ATP-binding subunit ClpB
MTTNIGSNVIQEAFEKLTDANKEQVVEQTKQKVFELLRQSMRPEFLNRIDETIMFKPLSREDMAKIVGIQFDLIQARLMESGIRLEADDKVLRYLAELGYDPQYGARPLKRVMQRELLNALSKEILSGKINKDSIVGITLADNNTIEFVNLDQVEI